MALIQCRFFSEVLGISTHATVILPQRTSGQIGMGGARTRDRLPVLYLLHGLSDDDSIWSRRTSIERYVADLELAVVMPNGYRGFYTDQVAGADYWTFVSEELPQLMSGFFPLSTARQDSFVAGLSMGGYGALKLALRCPDRFAAAASLSGALDVVGRGVVEVYPEWATTFGDAAGARGRSDDLLELVSQADAHRLPALYAWCGKQDFLLDDSRAFRDACLAAGVELTYRESAGDHSWEDWDRQIQEVLDWLPLRA